MCSSHNNRRKTSLGFTAEPVAEGLHICYLFNDDEERKRVMTKFLQSGVQEKEKLLYLVDTMTPDEMLDYLEGVGFDARAQASELTLTEAAPVYCPNGVFNGNVMLDTIRNFYIDAVEKEGYIGARGTGEMTWSLVEGRADESALLEYEAKINNMVIDHPLTVCCQYDARRFDGNVIMDVLAVHPMMIVQGQLVQNPYYVEPERFLREYKARAAG